MTAPLVVAIPHRLGREEAIRRLKKGLGRARTNFGGLMSVDHESWSGDRLTLQMRALGQTCSGTIDVFDDHLSVAVMLPWLLAAFAERLIPTIRKETTLLLEKK
jgi:hypothetical protein